MSDDGITKSLNKYFKQPTVDRGNLASIFQCIQEFSVQNLQTQMIAKIFKAAETNMTRDNLKVIVKRFLHIINQILEKDDSLLVQYRYGTAVSNQIVHQFISMLRNVLNYGPMDLLADLKLYRKRWAKRITDQAYIALQSEAQKQLKVDLDRGFQDQIVKKLTKSYQKRQFSKSDLERYLPVSNGQVGETRKSSVVESSYSSQEDKVKRRSTERPSQSRSQERVADRRNDNSDMVMSRHSFIPSISNTFGNGNVSDPRRPNQILHRPPQSFYQPNPYEMVNRVNNPAVGQINPYFNQTMNYYQPTGYPNYSGYPQNYNYHPNFQNYQNPQYENYEQPYPEQRYEVPAQQMTSKQSKLLQKMQIFKKNWFFQCKNCGLFISTGQKYEEHMMKHFNDAQKQYEISHSRADHSRKGNKPLMPTIQDWIHSKRVKLSDKKFQVNIENEGIKRNETCLICKGELKVQWSDEHESWVFEDAIRVKTKGHNSICHADCYRTIHEFQKSSDQQVK